MFMTITCPAARTHCFVLFFRTKRQFRRLLAVEQLILAHMLLVSLRTVSNTIKPLKNRCILIYFKSRKLTLPISFWRQLFSTVTIIIDTMEPYPFIF